MSFTNAFLKRPLLAALPAALLCLFSAGCGVFGGNETSPPSNPNNLQFDVTKTQIEVSWQESSDANGYNIYRAEESIAGDLSNASAINGEDPVEGSSFTDSNVNVGTVYYYRLTAVNDGGESDPSSESEVRMPPSAPSNIQLSASQSGVDVNWDAGTLANGYEVYRAKESISEDLSNATPVNDSPIGGDATTFSDGTAENSTEYFYRVTAVNESGESDPTTGGQVQMPFPEPDRPEGD
jgi:fibronectin type 3 domain-containing protein